MGGRGPGPSDPAGDHHGQEHEVKSLRQEGERDRLKADGNPLSATTEPGRRKLDKKQADDDPVEPRHDQRRASRHPPTGNMTNLAAEEAYIRDIESIDLTQDDPAGAVGRRARRKSDGSFDPSVPGRPSWIGRRKSTGDSGRRPVAKAASRKTKRRRAEPAADTGARLARRPTVARVKRRSVTFTLPGDDRGPVGPNDAQSSETPQMDIEDEARGSTQTMRGVQALLNLEGGPLKPALKPRTGVRVGPRRKGSGVHTKQPQRAGWTSTQLLLTDMLKRPARAPHQ